MVAENFAGMGMKPVKENLEIYWNERRHGI